MCVFLTVMETQTAIMDMDVFQTRLGVMLQYVTLGCITLFIIKAQYTWISIYKLSRDIVALYFQCHVWFSVFRDMFGEECVDFSDDKTISVTVDGKAIHICLETRVRSETKQRICLRSVVVGSFKSFCLTSPRSVRVL